MSSALLSHGRAFPSLLLPAVLLSCSPIQDPPAITEADYAIYAAALTDHFVIQGVRSHSARYLVCRRTVSRSPEMPMTAEHMGRIQTALAGDPSLAEAAQDFYRVSGSELFIDRRLPLEAPYDLIENATADSMRAVSGVAASVIARFSPDPPGLFTLSRVGFSRDRERAFIYIAFHGAVMHHWGRECFLARSEGQWRVLHWGNGWIT